MTAAPSHPSHQTTPATQIAPTLLTLARTPDGNQQMTVRLNPAELGMVQIRLNRAPSGTTEVQIVTDRPATLEALQRDQSALHRTLDEAGIPGAGRTIMFHNVAHSEPATANHSGPSQVSVPHAAMGRSMNSGQGGASGGSGQGDRGGRAPVPLPGKAPIIDAAVIMAKDTTIYRIGLNITA